MTPNQAPSEYVKKVAEQLGDWFDSRLGTNGVNYDRLLLQHKEAIATALQAERNRVGEEVRPVSEALAEAARKITILQDRLDEAAKVISPFANVAHHDDALASKDGGVHYKKAEDSTGICHCGFAPHDAGLTIGHCRAAADWLAKHKPV